MQDLVKPKVIEVRGIRVLTTRQIAEMYGTTKDKIIYNFNYNKEKYVLGKHYIEVSGDELRRLKTTYENQISFKYAKSLYFWTEKGALLHAKSLNTDKAWEVYDYLVDFYFRAKEQPPAPQTYREKREAALAEKKQQAGRPPVRQVVDAPENVAIQNAMKEVRKYLCSIDVALTECNKYCCEEKYLRIQNVLDTLWLSLGDRILQLRDTKPKIIEKLY